MGLHLVIQVLTAPQAAIVELLSSSSSQRYIMEVTLSMSSSGVSLSASGFDTVLSRGRDDSCQTFSAQSFTEPRFFFFPA